MHPTSPNLILIMADDLGESRDLASAHPDLVTDLLRAYEQWEQEVLDGVTLTT